MSEHVALNILLERNPGKELVVDVDRPITVVCAGVPWICTAVLERTAILVSGSDPNERHPVRHENCMVDPAGVEWREINLRPGGGKRSASPWRASRNAPRSADGKKQRDLSDERARKNQEEVAATAARELDAQLAASRAEAAQAVKSASIYAPDIHTVEDADPILPTDRSEFDDSFEEAEQRELADLETGRERGRPPALVLLTGRAEPDASEPPATDTSADQVAALEPAKKRKRPNGDGGVRERADGRWEARVVVDGVRKSLFAHSEEAALAMLVDALVEPTAGARREPMKYCPGCRQQKPKSEFPSGQGFFKCNSCRALGVLAQTSEHRDAAERNEELARQGMKHCPRCDRDLGVEAFNRNSSKGDGLQAICRKCQSDIYSIGSTGARQFKTEGENVAHKMGPEVTPGSDSAPSSEATETEPEKSSVNTVEIPAPRTRKNGRPALTFTELLNDLRQLGAYAAGLEQDNAALRVENEQLRNEQAGLYDELQTIVGGIKKATSRR